MKPFIFVIIVFNAIIVYGQKLSSFQNVQHLTDLPQHTVQALTQDENGFIWMGTESGLCRYDGKEVTTYKKGDNENFFLKDNVINSFATDALGRKWMASSEGVSVFEPEKGYQANIANKALTNRINKYTGKKVANVVYCKKNGDIVIGYSEGYLLFNENKNQFKYISFITVDKEKISPTVFWINEDEKGNTILLLKNYGLAFGNAATGEFIIDKAFSELHKKQSGIFMSAFKNTDSSYIFSFGSSLYTFTVSQKPSTNSIIKQLPLPPTQYNVLTWDKKRKVLLAGTDKEGFLVLDSSGNLIDWVRRAAGNNSLPSNNVYAIWCDKDGLGYWVGTSQGLSRFFFLENNFNTISTFDKPSSPLKVYPIYTKNNKDVFVGTIAHLYHYSFTDFKKTLIATPENTVARYYCIAPDGKGSLYLGTDQGFYICKENGGNRSYRLSDKHKELLRFNKDKIFYVTSLNDTIIYFAYRNDTAAGLAKWNKVKAEIHIYRIDNVNPFGSANKINSIQKKSETELLVACNMGLYNFNHLTEKFSYLLKDSSQGLLTSQINAFINKEKYLVAATYGGGATFYNKESKNYTTYTSAQGLGNNDLYSIHEVMPDNYWMSTNYGLSNFNKQTGKFINYQKENGLLDNEFNRNSSFICGDTAYFGGLSGFCFFNFKRNQQSGLSPKIFITNITLHTNGTDTTYENKDYSTLYLSPSQNSLQLKVAVPFYINPKATEIWYRLLPEGKEWINGGNNSSIILAGLSQGKHTVEVKAKSSEGVWSSNIASLTIKIRFYWYQTLLFKSTIILLTLGLFYLLYRFRINQLKKVIATRKKIASDLHDDLGGTLNSIKLYSHLAATENKPEHINRIQENTKEAVAGLKDLIWTLDDDKNSTKDLVEKINSFALPAFASNNIQFACSCNMNCETIRLEKEEKRNLYLIIKEAITNTLKHAAANKATVEITCKGEKLIITYADDGNGFNHSNITNGNGLKNIMERAKAIGYDCNYVEENKLVNGFNLTGR